MKYTTEKLDKISEIRTGKLDSNAAIADGVYPFFTCDPQTLRIDRWAYDTEAVLLAGNNASGNYTAKYYKGKFNAYQRTYIIEKKDKDVLNVRFLCYAINQQLRVLKSMSAGTTTKFLTIRMLNNLEIPCPNIKVQNKIADILTTYDDLIENNQKQIKLLEECAKRLYKEWFVDLRFPGHEQTKIVDGVPENWSVQLLSQVFSYVRGKSYSSSDIVDDRQAGISLINLNSIKPFGGYKRNAEKRYLGKVNDNQFVNAGDVLMGVTDMTQERRLVGHVALVPNLRKQATFSMDLIKLEPFTVPKYYLYASLRYGGYSNRIAQLANGVNVLHLKPESIMNLKMPIPQISILKKFDEVFASYQKKIEILENQMSLASEARDRLLPKLMNGEIEL